MAQFVALQQNVEVNGQTVLSVVNGMGAFEFAAKQLLKKNGIPDPQPDNWYLQQAWLDAFKEIHDKLGANTLFQIGLKIPQSAKFPPEIDDIEKALSAIDIAYHMNHRNGEIGHYNYSKVTAESAKMVCNNPYPCDFDRGIIAAMAQRFKPTGSDVMLMHDDTAPCRKKGGDSCTYHIAWKNL